MQSDEFGSIITDIRTRHNLTLETFATGINSIFRDPRDRVVKMTISYWARGMWFPPLSKIDYLRRYAPLESWQREFGERGCSALLEQSREFGVEPATETNQPVDMFPITVQPCDKA